MFINEVIHFGNNFGRSVKASFTEILKPFIEVPSVARLNIQVPSITMILIAAPGRVQDRVVPFGKKLGEQVKGRSPKELKSLFEVPNVVHMKAHVF